MPEGPPYYQLIEGELFMSPSPESFHQDIVLNLAFKLRLYLRESPIGKVFIAPLDVHLNEYNVLEPDLLFVSNGKREIVGRWIEGAPDMVAEIISPGTEKLDLRKKKIYAANGVNELWLIHPKRRVVEVYNLSADPETPAMFAEGDHATSPTFPGLQVPVAELFIS